MAVRASGRGSGQGQGGREGEKQSSCRVGNTHSGAICQIPQQTQQEEEQAQPIARPLPLILDDLWYARPQIADGAEVAQDLRPDGGRPAAALFLAHRRRSPRARLPRQRPTRRTHGAHSHEGDGVLHERPRPRRLFEDARQAVPPLVRAGPPQTCSACAATARQTQIVLRHIGQASLRPRRFGGLRGTAVRGRVAVEQWCLLGALPSRTLLRSVLLLLVPSLDSQVVQALRDEHQIRHAEVHGQGDHGGDESRPDCAGEVGHVADEPDEQEGERDAVGVAIGVVLDQLGHEEEDPRRERDAAEDAGQSLVPRHAGGRVDGRSHAACCMMGGMSSCG